ncbi:ATP-binding protein [Burkholderia plantarii]|uniref:ATP-binding protein n=1 Tax=Burkholderia plantarii TaxID=41899 RepID=UPI0018DE4A88|nr:ATP-binding protein [Burkholderia plantarii]MBI0328748.1 ATP-binding protein [Burkholderia plantarii]
MSPHSPHDAPGALPPFPFSALVGQAALQRALLLVAVDPAIGGVLVSGPRGTAKSTAARALAELLPEGRFVTLPLGAADEHVTGSLDLAGALGEAAVRFSPGLLARAHLGVLYVDEVNLLPDGLVDVLLDAAASGVNTVERDAISHSHAARFALVGTMNPEEGELRPQLLDRFGLMVELANPRDADERQRIVKARLAFDLDPQAFRAAHVDAQAALVERIRRARAALATVHIDDAVHARVAACCMEAAVDGLRADLVMLRAARALAALDGEATVREAHVERVADDVLRHRRTVPPAAPTPSRPSPDATRNEGRADGDAGAASSSSPSHAPSAVNPARDEADWGYLPPEPAGLVPVKGVIPLPSKKR